MKRRGGSRGGALFAPALGVLLAFPPPLARAQTAPESAISSGTISDAEIARMIRYRIDRQHRATEVVVGVLRPSGRSLLAYEAAVPKHARKPGGDTIFEIASLTKILTALLLADAVVRGEAKLDDPLADYVPKGAAVPQFQGLGITLTDLATHGAGLPIRPKNIHGKPDAPNKYAGYTQGQLYAGLADYTLTRPPGSKFEYSNVGFGLLGQGLALRAHTSYTELLRARVTGPLGMKDTRLGVDPAAKARLAQGHDVDLRPIGQSDDGALNPAGGLRSTASDLLRFLALFQDNGPGELPQAARLMLTVDRPGDDQNTHMALGWRRTVIQDETFYWSNGSGDGSRTFMGFNPALHIAVVVLADASSGAGFDDIGRHILDPDLVVDRTIIARRHVIRLPGAVLDRLAGNYQNAPDDTLKFERGDTGGLIVTSGASQFVVYPQTPTRFFMKEADLQLDFLASGSGAPSAVVLRQDGKAFTYKRAP